MNTCFVGFWVGELGVGNVMVISSNLAWHNGFRVPWRLKTNKLDLPLSSPHTVPLGFVCAVAAACLCTRTSPVALFLGPAAFCAASQPAPFASAGCDASRRRNESPSLSLSRSLSLSHTHFSSLLLPLSLFSHSRIFYRWPFYVSGAQCASKQGKPTNPTTPLQRQQQQQQQRQQQQQQQEEQLSSFQTASSSQPLVQAHLDTHTRE